MRRVLGFFALLGVIGIVVAYSLITHWNPLPQVQAWLKTATVRDLAKPGTTWTVRTGDEPKAVSVLPSGLVVTTEGLVEVRDPGTGTKRWSQADSWAGVAGSTDPVVIVGRPVGSGFDVYDVATGARLWGSDGKAGIWPYSDKILILTCSQTDLCRLRAAAPSTGATIWSLTLRAAGKPLFGFERPLAAPSPVATDYASPLAAMVHPAPALIGLPMGGDIHVVSTEDGRAEHVFTPNASTRIVVTAHTVVSATTVQRGNQCYFTARGLSPGSGGTKWSRTGLDLRTSTGLGCEQSRDPSGSGDVLLATDAGGRDAVVSARTGDVLARARSGEHVVALDGTLAVVRTADRHSLRAISLTNGHEQWVRAAGASTLVGVAPGFVLVSDPTGLGRLDVYGRDSGATQLSVTSTAAVLGVGPGSVIINIGRTIGPLTVP
jgi:outer membrane protein assembly factor BamB